MYRYKYKSKTYHDIVLSPGQFLEDRVPAFKSEHVMTAERATSTNKVWQMKQNMVDHGTPINWDRAFQFGEDVDEFYLQALNRGCGVSFLLQAFKTKAQPDEQLFVGHRHTGELQEVNTERTSQQEDLSRSCLGVHV